MFFFFFFHSVSFLGLALVAFVLLLSFHYALCALFFFWFFLLSLCPWLLSYFHISWGIHNKKKFLVVFPAFFLAAWAPVAALSVLFSWCVLFGFFFLSLSFDHAFSYASFFLTGFLTPCKASHPFICCVYLGFAGGLSFSIVFYGLPFLGGFVLLAWLCLWSVILFLFGHQMLHLLLFILAYVLFFACLFICFFLGWEHLPCPLTVWL